MADLGRMATTLRKLLDPQSAVLAVTANTFTPGVSVGRRCRLLMDGLGLSKEEQVSLWGKVTMQQQDYMAVHELTHSQVMVVLVCVNTWRGQP